MIAAQLAVEFRKMMLHVFVAYALFFVVAGEILSAAQIVLNAIHQIPGAVQILRLKRPAGASQQQRAAASEILRDMMASILIILRPFDSGAP